MKRARRSFSSSLVAAAMSALACALCSASDPTTPAPEISLSLRGVPDEIVEQGEPLRITVRLDAPPDTTDVIELAPASGTWSDAITVELTPAEGGPMVVRAELVGKAAAPHATLSATQVAGGLWRLSS